MKKLFLFLSCSLFIATLSFAQGITGEWNGILKAPGADLKLVFHISKTGTDYNATMDSPDQGAMGILISTTSFDGKNLSLGIEASGITYDATLDSDSNFVGEFKQSGFHIPLTLSRKAIAKKIALRPQEPVKPYPYKSEDVSFINGKGKDTLAGTLTLPEGAGNFPAVVLITGSGPQNRDEEILGHKPFLVLSDFLTRNGIAVLRYDDRGVASSTGNFANATTADFADDAEAAFNFLKTRSEIDKNKIGLIGHSEGGEIAPMIAARRKDVGFIVLLAGPGLPGDQILLLQQQLIGKAEGLNVNDLQKIKETNQGLFTIVKKYEEPEQMKTAISEYFTKKLFVDNDTMNNKVMIAKQVAQITSPWMTYFIKYDPAPALEKVKCPVLAINGSNDLQVPPKEDLAAIKKTLEKGGNKNVTVKEIPGLNHLFQTSATGNPSEYGSIEETFSPIAMNIILEWIKLQVK